jgi:hypothetical protein
VLETIAVAGGLFMGLAVMLALIDVAGKLGRLAEAAEQSAEQHRWMLAAEYPEYRHQAPTRVMTAARDGRG